MRTVSKHRAQRFVAIQWKRTPCGDNGANCFQAAAPLIRFTKMRQELPEPGDEVFDLTAVPDRFDWSLSNTFGVVMTSGALIWIGYQGVEVFATLATSGGPLFWQSVGVIAIVLVLLAFLIKPGTQRVVLTANALVHTTKGRETAVPYTAIDRVYIKLVGKGIKQEVLIIDGAFKTIFIGHSLSRTLEQRLLARLPAGQRSRARRSAYGRDLVRAFAIAIGMTVVIAILVIVTNTLWPRTNSQSTQGRNAPASARVGR